MIRWFIPTTWYAEGPNDPLRICTQAFPLRQVFDKHVLDIVFLKSPVLVKPETELLSMDVPGVICNISWRRWRYEQPQEAFTWRNQQSVYPDARFYWLILIIQFIDEEIEFLEVITMNKDEIVKVRISTMIKNITSGGNRNQRTLTI